MPATARQLCSTLAVLLSLSALAPAAKAQSSIFGDEFAQESGAIVVQGNRGAGRGLFDTAPVPEDSCLANAPDVGAEKPGFVIDASGLRRIRDLERLRRNTRAGTIYVDGGNFAGQRLRGAALYDMCFFGSDFSQTDWTGFAGSGLGFVGANLTGARMAGTSLPFVLFRDATLADVDARQAVWTDGQLDGGWEGSVRNLDLTGSNLTGFRVECGTNALNGCPTDREGLRLASANLRRASFYPFFFPELDLTGATIDQTELALDHLRFLDDAQLLGPVVLRSTRRALMLFPSEVRALGTADGPTGGGADPCFDAAEEALLIACSVPGSEVASLLRSVARLEAEAADGSGYADALAAWQATRDACLDNTREEYRQTCIVDSYRVREATLRSAGGAPDWLTQPGYRLFLSSEAAFPTGPDNPGLTSRILPIMLDSAVAAIIVRIDANGTIAARGTTDGGCYFSADGLIYEADSGRIALGEGQGRRRRAGEPLLILNSGSVEVANEGLSQLAACTADDAFPRLSPVMLGGDLLGDIYRRF